MCSWRLANHPLLQSPVVVEYSTEPWFSHDNLLWLARLRKHPTASDNGPIGCTRDFRTRLVAIVGPETVFPDDYGLIGEVPADTIVLIEYADSDFVQTQPGDLDVRLVTPAVTQGIEGDGLHVGFADGWVWYLDKSVPFELLRRFLTIHGAQQHDRDDLLLPYRRGSAVRGRT